MEFGTKVSAVGHGTLILLAVFGLPWFGPAERELVPVTNVSFVSEEAFERAASAPSPERREDAPPVPTSPRPAEAPEPVAEEVAAAPEPEPAEPGASAPNVPERVVPRVVTMPPTAAAPPRVRPTPTVAPEPAEAEPVELPQPLAEPEPDVEVARDEPPAALPEPSPELDRPEPETPRALMTSARPMSRPERLVERAAVAPSPEPVEQEPAEEEPAEPESVEQVDATAAAVLAAVQGASARPAAPAATSLNAGPPLSGSEKEGLKLAVQRCWNVPAGLRDAQSLKVTIGAEFAADGSVINASIRLVDPSPAPDARFQQAYEAGRRALIRCAPYSMPRDKYAQWRNVEIVFNPEGMVSW